MMTMMKMRYHIAGILFLLSVLHHVQGLSEQELVVPGMVTYQSSTMDGARSDLANDGNSSTCSMTGRETVPWFKVDLETIRNVTSVYIRGLNILWNVKIRVGNHYNPLGARDGHEQNSRCQYWWTGPIRLDLGQEFICERMLRGRYISVETKSPSGPWSISVCEISIKGDPV